MDNTYEQQLRRLEQQLNQTSTTTTTTTATSSSRHPNAPSSSSSSSSSSSASFGSGVQQSLHQQQRMQPTDAYKATTVARPPPMAYTNMQQYPHKSAWSPQEQQQSPYSGSWDYGYRPEWKPTTNPTMITTIDTPDAIVIATPPASTKSQTTTTITITTTTVPTTRSSSDDAGRKGNNKKNTVAPSKKKKEKDPLSKVKTPPSESLLPKPLEASFNQASSTSDESASDLLPTRYDLMFVQPTTTGLDPEIAVCSTEELKQLPVIDGEPEMTKLDLHYLKPLFAKKQVDPETKELKKKRKKAGEPGQVTKQPIRFEFKVPRQLLDPNICITVWCLKRYVLLQCNDTFLKATEYPLKALVGISVDRFFGTKPRDPTVAKSRELSYKLRESLLQHTGEVARTDTAYFSRTGIIVRQVGAIKVLRSNDEPVALISYQTVVTRHEPEVRTRTRGSRVASIPEPKIEKIVELASPSIKVETPTGKALDMEELPPATQNHLGKKKSRDSPDFSETEDL